MKFYFSSENINIIKKYINNELKFEKLKHREKEEKELKELCSAYFINQQGQQDEIMNENNFKNLIQLSDSEICEIIIDIFGKENEKKEKIITLNEIKYLYYSLTSSKPIIKMILIIMFMFQKKHFLPYTILQKNIFILFGRDTKLTNFLVLYSNKIFIDKGNNSKKKKKQDEVFIIQDFINNIDEEGLKFLNDFHFIKKIIGASEYKLDLIKNENLNYICDCAKIPIEENLENNLDSMKRNFDYMTSKLIILCI